MNIKLIRNGLNFLTRHSSFLRVFFKWYFENRLRKSDVEIYRQLKKFKPLKKQRSVTLIERVEDYEYLIKLAAASKALSDLRGTFISDFNPYWTSRIGWEDRSKARCFGLLKSKSKKLYSSFSRKTIYSAANLFRDQGEVEVILNAIMLTLKTKEDVLNIKIRNVLCGDLIYDSYLRYYNTVTILDVHDDKLRKLIRISIDYFLGFQSILDEQNVDSLIVTYSSYITSGIPVRVALDMGVPVFSLASHSVVIKQLEKKDPLHIQEHWNYDKNKAIDTIVANEVLSSLDSRFAGKIDTAIAYMKTSSFKEGEVSETFLNQYNSKNRNVIIYAHDFYDSPHAYRQLKYTDLYTYTCELVKEISNDRMTNYWVKKHPNSIGDCHIVLAKIIEDIDLDHIRILPDSVYNNEIVNLKPDLIVTARGTIGLEMGFFNIPVVALDDNPFINFDFVHSCTSIDEYYEIVLGKSSPEVNCSKSQIVSFYFQHYLEQMESVKGKIIFNYLKSYSGNSFSDDYLNYIHFKIDDIFSENFINSYTDKFSELLQK
jgi:hypothetical protein